MRFSKKRIALATQKEIIQNLAQVLADLHQLKQTKQFLQDFLTRAELLTLAKRLAVVLLLEKNAPYGEIKQKLGVSSATIASVGEMMQKNPEGFKTALKDLEAEKWASDLSQKISRFFKGF